MGIYRLPWPSILYKLTLAAPSHVFSSIIQAHMWPSGVSLVRHVVKNLETTVVQTIVFYLLFTTHHLLPTPYYLVLTT